MLRTRAKTCARCCHSGHPAKNHDSSAQGRIQNSGVTKPHCRGGCAALRKGVLKHRPRSGVAPIMHVIALWRRLFFLLCGCRALTDQAPGRGTPLRARARAAPPDGNNATRSGVRRGAATGTVAPTRALGGPPARAPGTATGTGGPGLPGAGQRRGQRHQRHGRATSWAAPQPQGQHRTAGDNATSTGTATGTGPGAPPGQCHHGHQLGTGAGLFRAYQYVLRGFQHGFRATKPTRTGGRQLRNRRPPARAPLRARGAGQHRYGPGVTWCRPARARGGAQRHQLGAAPGARPALRGRAPSPGHQHHGRGSGAGAGRTAGDNNTSPKVPPGRSAGARIGPGEWGHGEPLSRQIPAMCGANQQPPQGSRQGPAKAGKREAKSRAGKGSVIQKRRRKFHHIKKSLFVPALSPLCPRFVPVSQSA